jgi:hypothetical protein
MENIPTSSGALFFYCIVLIIAFFTFREVILWYYKINERIYLQNEANNHLKKISEQNAEILNLLQSVKEE